MGWWPFGPDEFAVFVAFVEDADEARLAIKYAAYVGWCDSRVAPGGGNSEA